MPVAAGHIMEVTFSGLLYGQRLMNIFHLLTVTTPTATAEIVSQNDMITRLRPLGSADLVTPYLACMSDQYTFDTLRCQYVYPQRIRASTLGTSVAGALSGAAGPTNTSGFLEFITDFAGRKYRGGMHMGALPDAVIVSGKLTSPQIVRYSTFCTSFLLPIAEVGGTGSWVTTVLHRTHPLSGANTIITGAFAQTTARTMRRRTVGVGK